MANNENKVYRSIAEVLLDWGMIDQKRFEEIGLSVVKTGQTEEEIIKALRVASEAEFTKAKAAYNECLLLIWKQSGFLRKR